MCSFKKNEIEFERAPFFSSEHEFNILVNVLNAGHLLEICV